MAVTGTVRVPTGLLLVVRALVARLDQVVPGVNAVPVGAEARAVVVQAMTGVVARVQAVADIQAEGGVHRAAAIRVAVAVGLIVAAPNAAEASAAADMREPAEGLGTRAAMASALVPLGPMGARVAPLADGKEIGADGPRRLDPIGLIGLVVAVETAVLIGPCAAQPMDPGEMPLAAIGLVARVHVLRVGRRAETRVRRADSKAAAKIAAAKAAPGEPEILVTAQAAATAPGTNVKTAVQRRVDPTPGTMCVQARTRPGPLVNAVPATLLRCHSIEFGRCVQMDGRSSAVPAIEEILPRRDHLARRRSPGASGRPISSRTCVSGSCCPSRSAGRRTPPIR